MSDRFCQILYFWLFLFIFLYIVTETSPHCSFNSLAHCVRKCLGHSYAYCIRKLCRCQLSNGNTPLLCCNWAGKLLYVFTVISGVFLYLYREQLLCFHWGKCCYYKAYEVAFSCCWCDTMGKILHFKFALNLFPVRKRSYTDSVVVESPTKKEWHYSHIKQLLTRRHIGPFTMILWN